MPQGQYPTVNAGQVFTASLIQGFSPFNAWKASDTSRASTTTLANDPDLSINVAANATYRLDGFLSYTGDVTGSGGIKWAFTGPAGVTLDATAFYLATAVSNAGLTLATVGGTGTTYAAVTDGATPLPVIIWGTLFTGSTTGAFALQWSQNASDATATVMKAGSRLTLTRLA